MTITMKQARVGIGASQKEIAEKLGVHEQTYGRMEKNPEDVTIGQAIAFSKIVGLKVEDIFFSTEL